MNAWRLIVAAILALPISACAGVLTVTPQATQIVVTLNASPTTGTCPYTSNVSWSATNASACTMSGSWSGTAAASGSRPVEVNSSQMTLTLTCSANTESALLKWTNPTQNVDGTAVGLKGNKVFHAPLANEVINAPPIVIEPAVAAPTQATYLLTGLPAGVRYAGVRATSSVSPFFDSDMSNVVSWTVVLPSGSATKQLGCTTPPTPKPPTAVTIGSTVWDSIPGREGIFVGRDVGTIGVPVDCVGQEPVTVQSQAGSDVLAEYWAVRRDDVTLYRKPRSQIVLARCVMASS
jgi:hypothetical protein